VPETVAPQARSAAEAEPLDLHEEICAEARPKRCSRWPRRLALISNLGQIVAGRCGSPNLCEYCARLAAVLNAELLALDAMHGVAPTSYVVLTQPSSDPAPRAYYESRRQVQRTLRREIDGYQAAWLLEFTTGRAERSGGLRRPHFNALTKGVDSDDHAAIVRQVIDDVWCPRQGATSAAQYVAPVQEMGGLTRYLALHFLKERQAPPHGWRGHRFSATRGYFWLPTPQARKLAQDSLVNKRELWRAIGRGLSAAQAEEHVAYAASVRAETTWALGHNPQRDEERHERGKKVDRYRVRGVRQPAPAGADASEGQADVRLRAAPAG
jgi:hypothetical protein